MPPAMLPAVSTTAYAYYPGNYVPGGDIWFGTQYNFSLAKLGNYYFTTALHELGQTRAPTDGVLLRHDHRRCRQRRHQRRLSTDTARCSGSRANNTDSYNSATHTFTRG
ncbi:hypothetical protein [Bradyrhizobium yuanmingense]|uniref:hypothetical protein n=1 Tax=Bradyrhizobium yuanmingense TaxID=108015 RepID=UPI0023BA24C0|nr:hypothetical protein [Bradyrhizobium yuanmingense]MDF0585119.1 hypothetical protein [Bradyrhizobium yuanmingense]